jgi:sugar phosphate isomerase/epimerase
MRRSIATVSLSGSLKEKIEAIAAAHFDAVEIFENDLLFYEGSATEIRSVAENLGLQIGLFQPFRDFEAVSPEQFHRNIDRAERKFELMQGLGGEFFQLYTDFFEDRFYFEIVERRGDYVGFGAVNAPVRLAAQDEAYRRSLIDSEESY